MADQFIVTIDHDGEAKQIEVSPDAIQPADGYVIQTQDVLDNTIKSRLARERSKLSADDEFRRGVLESYGIPLGDDGKPALPKGKADASEIERLKASIHAQEVKPLKERAEQLEQRLQSMLGSRKQAEILRTAAELGVQEWALKPMPNSEQTMIENLVGPMIDYAADHDQFAQVATRKGGETQFVHATKPGRAYAGIADVFAAMKQQAEFRHLFADDRGGNLPNGKSTSGTGKTVSRATFDGWGHAERAAYAKDGGKVVD